MLRDWGLAESVGPIREVHAYSRKNYWTDKPIVKGSVVPDTLDWNLYLNRAEETPFSISCMNREWIRYTHFSGAVADMAPHIFDPAYYALDHNVPSDGWKGNPGPHKMTSTLYSHSATGNKSIAWRIAQHDAGGLVGRGYRTISNCYCTGHVPQDANKMGGLIGYNHGVISDSFWDADRSGQADGTGGTGQAGVNGAAGKTTEQMRTASLFIAAGWDFEGESANGTEDIWTIREGETYPRFVRQQIQGDFVGREGVDSSDLAFFAVRWMEGECDTKDDCNGIDLDGSGRVDAGDLMALLDYWLVGVDWQLGFG